MLSSVLVEKNILEQLGGFRGLYRSQYFKHTADHDCWLGLLQLTNLVYIDSHNFIMTLTMEMEKSMKLIFYF